MASTDLVAQSEDDDDLGLTTQQVRALEKLDALGAGPAPIDHESGKAIYDSRPQIRALQLVFEGRLGGPGRGQGRKREPRVAEVLAEEIRQRFGKKMVKALDRALSKDAGHRVNLDAIKLSVDIERGERALQLAEEKQEEELSGTKEEILGALFELVEDPAVAEAIEGEFEEITDAQVIEDDNSGSTQEAKPRRASSPRANGRTGDPADPTSNGRNGRGAGSNGRRGTARDRAESPNPIVQAALRRSKQRR
jgi:hypothetical protein